MTSSIIGSSALFLASGYLLISLIFQFRPLSTHFNVLDRLAILPRWKFFTLDNIHYELGLEIQDRDADSGMSAWQPIDRALSHPLRQALWYPEKFSVMILIYALNALEHRLDTAKEMSKDASRAYTVVLATSLRAAPPAQSTRARRFRVTRRSTAAPNAAAQMLFVSEFEPL